MKFKQSRITIVAAAPFAVMTLLLAWSPATPCTWSATGARSTTPRPATETRAMRLVLDAAGAAPADMPGPVADFELAAADKALAPDAKRAKAREILFDDKYYADVASIMGPTKEFQTALNERTAAAVKSASRRATRRARS